MERYLRHLHADIEASIGQAPQPPESGRMPRLEDEEDESFETPKLTSFPELFGIPHEAFPPEDLLNDEQVEALCTDLALLWKAWNLWWEMPLYLSPRKQYAAMLREMKDGPIPWHFEWGCEIKICDRDNGKPCPFAPESSYCFCQHIDETARHDIALWEEHVRSQGLDPYRELSPEEEAAFEEEMRVRSLRKRLGDDWDQYDYFNFTEDGEENEDFDDDFPAAAGFGQEDEDVDDDDLDWFVEDEPDLDAPDDAEDLSDGNGNNRGSGFRDWDELDLPF